MEKTKIDYYSKNMEAIEELLVHIKEFERYLKTTMNDVAKCIEFESYQTPTIKCSQWFTKGEHLFQDLLVHDIKVEDSIIAIDACLYPENYYIEIFLRKCGKKLLKNKTELNQFLINKTIIKNGNNLSSDRSVYRRDFSSLTDMVDALNEIIKKICK